MSRLNVASGGHGLLFLSLRDFYRVLAVEVARVHFCQNLTTVTRLHKCVHGAHSLSTIVLKIIFLTMEPLEIFHFLPSFSLSAGISGQGGVLSERQP